jgi:predicted metal-dependent peptidase
VERLDKSDVRELYADPAGAARQARDKLAAARVWLMKHKPFFGVLARAFRLEPTLEVAGFRLYPDDRLRCNSIVTLQAGFPSLCARLAHISLHAALGAFGRRREREPRRWNVAHDLAIAPLLDAAELSVGGTSSRLFAELPAGASAEVYYEALQEGIAPDDLWCDLCDADQTDESERTMDGPLPSTDERGLELQWKMRLGAAYEEEIASGGLTFGDMPEWLEEMVRATIEPPADWSVILQHAVTSLHRTDRTYLRPSRRMAALMNEDGSWPNLVSMPGRRIEQAGQLVVVVDTSASVTVDMLSRFLGAIASVATAEGIDDVRLMCADAVVASDKTMFAAELLFEEIQLQGRGGTDFSPALRKLAIESKRYAQRFTIAYLTDLDGRFPPAKEVAHLDVLWIVPRPPEQDPPFGRVLQMIERV